MSHLLDDESPRRERELTLSTGAILGIFAGLAILCGAFFGFGYNMGRKSAPTPLNLSDVASGDALPSPSGAPPVRPSTEPAVETTLPEHTAAPAHATRHGERATPPKAASGDDALVTVPSTPSSPAASTKPAAKRTATATTQPAPIVRQPPSPPAAATAGAPEAAGAGSFVVQVAAVSHQEDAQLLAGALRSRGYAVSTHTNAGDKFIRVQVGPFHDKKQAEAMRQRLLTDGYNAIVK